MAFQFAGCLYRNSREFHDAIAAEYMTAGGLNGDDFIRDQFATNTSASITDDMLSPDQWANLSDNESFDRDEMINAFDRLREDYQ